MSFLIHDIRHATALGVAASLGGVATDAIAELGRSDAAAPNRKIEAAMETYGETILTQI